jgi:hypothetical protein
LARRAFASRGKDQVESLADDVVRRPEIYHQYHAWRYERVELSRGPDPLNRREPDVGRHQLVDLVAEENAPLVPLVSPAFKVRPAAF